MHSRLLCAFALLSVLSCFATSFASPPPRYETRIHHDPDGTGKFYMGREIAQVMGPGGIDWLERPQREIEETPQQVLDALEVHAGDNVVDLGAGSGFYTFKLATLVGSKGAVIAVEIQDAMLRALRIRAAREGLTNVGLVKGTEQDPRLPAGRVDLVLMVDVYHELAYPYEVMRNIVRALKPGGRVAIVEFRGEDDTVPIKPLHTMTIDQLTKEMAVVGLKPMKLVALPWQHVMVFGKEK